MFSFTKEELLQNRPRQRRISRKNRSKGKQTKKIAIVFGLALLIILIGFWLHKSSTAYAIMINGSEAALVESRSEGEKAVQDFLAEKSKEYGKTVEAQDKVEIVKVQVNKKDTVFSQDVSGILAEKLNVLTPGAAVVVDGKDKVYVTCKDIGNKLIERIKDQYSYSGKNVKDLKVIKSEIKEKVEIIEKNVPAEGIVDEEKAFQLLTMGTEKIEVHVVESGESFWSIAKDNKLSVDDLIAANPQLNPDKINIGDEVKLTKIEPMIHVTSVIECSEVEVVPFETKYINDSTMLRGNNVVKQKGENGSKEFMYRIVLVNGNVEDKQYLDAKVLSKPVTKVVQRGTKIVLASRSSGGSGELIWPTRGRRITSPFGYRHGEFHTGLDIDGSTGDPIRAAETGTVIFVGWSGNYGRMVKIDHGGGIQTWYAHLSKYNVSVGQKVEQGDIIGAMGSTGRSTGSHLHFEVRINGNAVNPIKYLD